jgi:peptidoglycan/LPS O-acetylase OafA/YrhL
MSDPRAFQGLTSLAPESIQRLMAPFWYGHLAVAAFIVISGFCLQVSLFQGRDGRLHRPAQFFARRAKRILPAYYGCLAISLVVALTVTSKQTEMPFVQYVPVTQENVLAHLFLVHNWSPAWMYKINGVLWSIAVEVQLYLLFPLLVWLLFKVGRMGTLALTGVLVWGVIAISPAAIKLYPWYLTLFALGMVGAHFAYRPPIAPRWLAWCCGLVCLAGLGWVPYARSAGFPLPIRDLGIAAATSAFCAMGALSPWIWPVRMAAFRPLAGLGVFSYSLYLMHHPIQQLVFVSRPAWIQDEGQKFAYLWLIGLPIIVAGSWLFSLAFEQPFLRKRGGDAAADNQELPWTLVKLPLKGFESTKPKLKRDGKSSKSPGVEYAQEQSSANPS